MICRNEPANRIIYSRYLSVSCRLHCRYRQRKEGILRVSIGRGKKVYQCAHVIIRYWDNGIDVELFEVVGRRDGKLIIEMPQDGKVVKVMNDNGDVINRLEWTD